MATRCKLHHPVIKIQTPSKAPHGWCVPPLRPPIIHTTAVTQVSLLLGPQGAGSSLPQCFCACHFQNPDTLHTLHTAFLLILQGTAYLSPPPGTFPLPVESHIFLPQVDILKYHPRGHEH
jgi:hypothetical protein